jgi:membrane-associated phospholipid phosphatase
MHVALSWIMGAAMLGQRGRVADALVIVTVVLISASTLFVKQHLIVDVVAGIVWGLGAWWLVRRRRACLAPSAS